MKKMEISKLSSQKKKKIEEAKKNYQKMWEEIKPFIKERKIKQYSTTGEGKMSSHETQWNLNATEYNKA